MPHPLVSYALGPVERTWRSRTAVRIVDSATPVAAATSALAHAAWERDHCIHDKQPSHRLPMGRTKHHRQRNSRPYASETNGWPPSVRSGADIRITAKVDIFGHFWTFLYHGLVEMSTLAVIFDVCPGPHC